MLTVPYSQSSYLPNNGQAGTKPPRPLSFTQALEARFPEPDCLLPVYILVRPGSSPDPRDRPWSLIWLFAFAPELVPALYSDPFYHPSSEESDHEYAPTACPVPGSGTPGAINPFKEPHRVIGFTRSVEVTMDQDARHFAYWGGCTRAWTAKEMRGAKWVLVGVLNREERMRLEMLAKQVAVMRPEHSWWNGQNWIVALLNGAVEEMIITRQEAGAALMRAATVPC